MATGEDGTVSLDDIEEAFISLALCDHREQANGGAAAALTEEDPCSCFASRYRGYLRCFQGCRRYFLALGRVF